MKLSGAFLLALVILWVSGCTLTADIFSQDSAKLTVVFVSPNKLTYTKEQTKEVKWQPVISGVGGVEKLAVKDYQVDLFEGSQCKGVLLESQETPNESYTIQNMTHEKVYSVSVTPMTTLGEFPAVCSERIIADQAAPASPTLAAPPVNGLVGQKELNFIWETSQDDGAGLDPNEPYILTLYEGSNCAGTVLKVTSQKETSFHAENLQDGKTYSLKVASKDIAGNLSNTTCSASMEVDSRIPAMELSDPSSRNPDDVSKNQNVSVSITNANSAAYYCFTEDLNFLPTTTGDVCPAGIGGMNGWSNTVPAQLTLSNGDGTKNLQIWIADSNGIVITPHPGVYSINLDTTAPANFSVIGIGGGSDLTFDDWLRTTLTPTVKWTSSTDAYEYSLTIKSADLQQTVCPEIRVPAPSLEKELIGCQLEDQKSYVLQMSAIDYAGNATTSADFTFTTNNVPPGIFNILGVKGGADVLADNWLGTTDPVVSWSASNRSDFYKLQILDEQAQEICSLQVANSSQTEFDYGTSPGSCQLFNDGASYQVQVTAQDFAGNMTHASNHPFLFRVDRSAPTLNISNTPAPHTSQTTAAFSVTANDILSGISSLQCRLDSGASSSCADSSTLSGLTEGLHTFTARATDLTGNTQVDSYSWTVDTSAPTVSITHAPPANDSSVSGHFVFTYSDTYSPLLRFDCTLDGTVATNCLSPFNYAALSEGEHTFAVVAVDAANNSSTEATYTWKVDLTSPTITLQSGPSDPSHSIYDASFVFTVSDDLSGVSSIKCQLDGGPLEDCISGKTYTGLSTGAHSFLLNAIDNSGNSAQQSYSWTIYSYTWKSSAWSACSAAQPSWSVGAWSACSAAQPAYQYGAWGSCSVSCGGGLRYRTETCPVVSGTQTRSVSCVATNGTQTRTVWCERNDGVTVAESFCLSAKPNDSQACTRTDCPTPTPDSSQSCPRGGGTDCNSKMATSEACNTQACCTAANNTSNMCAGYTYCGGCGSAGGTCASGSSVQIGWCSDCPMIPQCQCN
ncbi:Ig-like domain-containing protein [Bdellovibrio sp.]|uniref:Ig-like domain-containing protein n=1 Tax=Bdellovibrio sp. TaxID=28201 RepID=UPI0039E6A22C